MLKIKQRFKVWSCKSNIWDIVSITLPIVNSTAVFHVEHLYDYISGYTVGYCWGSVRRTRKVTSYMHPTTVLYEQILHCLRAESYNLSWHASTIIRSVHLAYRLLEISFARFHHVWIPLSHNLFLTLWTLNAARAFNAYHKKLLSQLIPVQMIYGSQFNRSSISLLSLYDPELPSLWRLFKFTWYVSFITEFFFALEIKCGLLITWPRSWKII